MCTVTLYFPSLTRAHARLLRRRPQRDGKTQRIPAWLTRVQHEPATTLPGHRGEVHGLHLLDRWQGMQPARSYKRTNYGNSSYGDPNIA